MKTNVSSVRLNSRTTLPALKLQAERARLISETSAKAKAEDTKKKSRKATTKTHRKSPIEDSVEKVMRIINNHICADWTPAYSVVKSKDTGRYASFATLSIFDAKELAEYRRLCSEYRAARRGSIEEPRKPKAIFRFDFYPSPLDAQRLGSIAIYGDDVVRNFISYTGRKSIFGFRLRRLSIEVGMRPFIFMDVTDTNVK